MHGFESHLGQLTFSLKRIESGAVSGGVVVLPCFVLNRSHRFNHVEVYMHIAIMHTIYSMYRL